MDGRLGDVCVCNIGVTFFVIVLSFTKSLYCLFFFNFESKSNTVIKKKETLEF